jgi:hypothetical protein
MPVDPVAWEGMMKFLPVTSATHSTAPVKISVSISLFASLNETGRFATDPLSRPAILRVLRVIEIGVKSKCRNLPTFIQNADA